MKSFSVIIPTLNEEFFIRNLLDDIYHQSLKPKELILVDGFSTDNTRKIIKHYILNQNNNSTILLSCPPNIASQRNYGARNATGRILIFLDADTRLPTKDFFKTTIEQINNSSIACPFYFPFNSNFLIFAIYLFFNLMFFLFQKISPSGAGSSIIINNKVFKQARGFNTNIKFEDIELIRRAAKEYSFKMIPSYILVSDRRFKKYGVLRTTIQYLILSVFFLFNNFNTQAGLSYQFGKYQKKK